MKQFLLWMLRKLYHKEFYTVDEMVDWGNCGICGKSMTGVFPADWNWEMCERCKKEHKR